MSNTTFDIEHAATVKIIEALRTHGIPEIGSAASIVIGPIVSDAIAAAVAAERERCERLALDVSEEEGDKYFRAGARAAARRIRESAAIRASNGAK